MTKAKTEYITTLIMINSEIVATEIYRTLKVMQGNLSLNSSDDLNELFMNIIPDSTIAQNYSVAKTIVSYVTIFGLATHFKNLLLKKLKQGSLLCFLMKSFNETVQKCQMDFSIRFGINLQARPLLNIATQSFLIILLLRTNMRYLK